MADVKKSGNICSRCGKQRVVVSTYEETVGVSVITCTEMSCPDPACQKLVEKNLTNEAHKRKAFKVEQGRREVERKERASETLKNKNKSKGKK